MSDQHYVKIQPDDLLDQNQQHIDDVDYLAADEEDPGMVGDEGEVDAQADAYEELLRHALHMDEDVEMGNDQFVKWVSEKFGTISDGAIAYLLEQYDGDILQYKPLGDVVKHIGVIVFEHERNGSGGARKRTANNYTASNDVVQAQKQKLEASKNCLKHWMITRSIMNTIFVGDEDYGPMFAVLVLKRPSSSKRGGTLNLEGLSEILAQRGRTPEFATATQYLTRRLTMIAKDVPSDTSQLSDARLIRCSNLGLELNPTNLNLMAKLVCDLIVHFSDVEYTFDLQVGKRNQAEFYRNESLDALMYDTTNMSLDDNGDRFGQSMGVDNGMLDYENQHGDQAQQQVSVAKRVLQTLQQKVTDTAGIIDSIVRNVDMDPKVRQLLTNAASSRQQQQQQQQQQQRAGGLETGGPSSLVDDRITNDEECVRLLSFLNPTERNFLHTDDYDVEGIDFNRDVVTRRIFAFWRDVRHHYDVGRERAHRLRDENGHGLEEIDEEERQVFETAEYALSSLSCPTTVMSQATAMYRLRQIHQKRKASEKFVTTLASDLSAAEMCDKLDLFSPSFALLCQIARAIYLYGNGDIELTPHDKIIPILLRAGLVPTGDDEENVNMRTLIANNFMALAIQRVGHAITMMRHLRSPSVFGSQHTENNLIQTIEHPPSLSDVGLSDIHRCGSATRTLPEIIEGTEDVAYGLGPQIPQLMKRVVDSAEMLNDIHGRAKREAKHQNLVRAGELDELMQRSSQTKAVSALGDMLEQFMARVLRQKVALAQRRDWASFEAAREHLVGNIQELMGKPLDEATKRIIGHNIERQMTKESEKAEERTISFDVVAGLNSGTLTFNHKMDEFAGEMKALTSAMRGTTNASPPSLSPNGGNGAANGISRGTSNGTPFGEAVDRNMDAGGDGGGGGDADGGDDEDLDDDELTMDARTKIPPFALFNAVRDAIRVLIKRDDGDIWKNMMPDYTGDLNQYDSMEERAALLECWSRQVFGNPAVAPVILLQVMRHVEAMKTKKNASSSSRNHLDGGRQHVNDNAISQYDINRDDAMLADGFDNGPVSQRADSSSDGKKHGKTRRGGVMKISDAHAKKKMKK